MPDDANPAAKLAPGDLCHHGSNALPLFRVVWIDGGKAWLRDVNSSADSVVDLERCRACWPEVDGVVPNAADGPPIGPEPLRWPDGTPRP